MAQQQKAGGDIRILSVVWYKVLPPRFGGQKGVALFNEHLGRLAPLLCLCSRNNEPYPGSYRIKATLPESRWQFLNPFTWTKICATAKKERATHLVLEFPYHGIAGFLCKKWLGVKLVVHEHNIECLRFREQGKRWWKWLFYYERWTLRLADAVFFKTEKERNAAVGLFRLDAKKTLVVPYGIAGHKQVKKQDAKQIIYQRHSIAQGTKLLLFAGTLDYEPNAAAVEAMERILIPLLNKESVQYRMLVCGRIEYLAFSYLKKMNNDRLVYAGNVEDIETYLSAADVFVNPVATGGGVQTKVVDALSFGLNVVCFGEMTEGISGAEKKIFTAPKNNWRAFADATVAALQKNEPTPEAFFDRHHWTAIAQKAYHHFCSL